MKYLLQRYLKMYSKRYTLVLLPVLFAALLSGCGEKEYVVEYGVDGYVYPARLLHSMSGADDLKVLGDYLYYTQDTGNDIAVRRVPVAEMVSGEGEWDFSKQETVASFSYVPFLLPEDTAEDPADIDFPAFLDSDDYGKGSGMELGKRYGIFSLTEYAVDSERNLYYYLDVSVGADFNMERAGGILGKQTAAGQQVYRMYLPEMAGMAVNGEGMVFVLTGEQILILDREGKEAGSLSTEEYHSGESIPKEELFTDSEGRVYYTIVNDRYVRNTYKVETKDNFRLQDAGEILGDGFMNASPSSDGNIFLFAPDSESILYEYDINVGSKEKVLSWYESGLMGSAVRSVVRITPDILLVNYNNYAGEAGIYQLTRTPAEEAMKKPSSEEAAVEEIAVEEMQEDAVEKEVLVIASPSSSSELQEAVVKFNAQSDDYLIVINSYGARDELEEGNGWVCPQLDAGLVSDDPPDILDLAVLGVVKYAEKGVLEDLTPYIENSGSLDMDDIPENLRKGLTFDGKFICLPFSFSIQGIAARKSQVESFDNWTMDELYRLSESHPESVGQLVNDGLGRKQQREWLLEEFCAPYYLDKFVDWEKGECSFDSEEFRRLLTWTEVYGPERKQRADSAGAVFLYRQYIPKNALLVSQNWLNFHSLLYLDMQYGEEACLMGYPGREGKGYFSGQLEQAFGIVANSAHKEAAWEFLEYYREINTMNSLGHSLLASKSWIKEKYQDLTTEESLGVGLDGEPKMKEKGFVTVQDETVYYNAIPKEQADAVLEAIETADFTPLSEAEETIIKIVTEEAESYYSGGKSLEEVTAVIQNRAELVLRERK